MSTERPAHMPQAEREDGTVKGTGHNPESNPETDLETDVEENPVDESDDIMEGPPE